MRRAAILVFSAVAFALLALPPQHGAAADINAGIDAYGRADYAAALANLRPLAEAGNPQAQYLVAQLYKEGRGVPEDARTAAEWYQRAALQGYGDAAFTRGFMLYYGAGDGSGAVQADQAAAAPWLKRAADQGDANAQALLGGMYRRGSGVTADTVQARYFLALAADQGVVSAQNELGTMLAIEPGFNNAIEAYKWFTLAARQGYPGAAQNRDAIASRLNPAEMQQALVAADGWRARGAPSGGETISASPPSGP